MRFLLLVILLFNAHFAHAQCSCRENLDSLSGSVETNYIAFQKKVDSIGGYKSFLDKLKSKADAVTDFDCYSNVLKAYLAYFNDPHLNLNLVGKGKNIDVIKSYFKDWPGINISRDSIIRYFNLHKLDPLEGIWQSTSLKTDVAVIRNANNRYVGIIMQSDSILWNFGQIRMELTRNGNAFDILYYRKDHTPLSTTAYLQDNQLIVQRVGSWNKVVPVIEQKDADEGIRFELLGEDASVLTINSFLIDKKIIIDSLIQANDHFISHRKYLIIDLRNNGGGHIMSVYSILPYLYSKPILMDGLEVKSSVENIQIYREVRNTKGFSADDREAFDSIIHKLEQNPNKIVSVSQGDVFTLDSVKSNPLMVAIVTNETTASSAELFILWARQSAKVILFGRRTSGALDYTEIGRVRTLPCSVFSFICPMGANDHAHAPYIDNLGIEPDVHLNYGTSDWIKSVYDYLKKTPSPH